MNEFCLLASSLPEAHLKLTWSSPGTHRKQASKADLLKQIEIIRRRQQNSPVACRPQQWPGKKTDEGQARIVVPATELHCTDWPRQVAFRCRQPAWQV